jgi:hypothetical protein
MPPRPSTYILRKAWLLGQKMARKERRLRPDVRDVAQYPTYGVFKEFHRHAMEMRSGFEYWDKKLHGLMEREGNGRGVRIDDPRVWDAFYTYYGEPIRDVFWAAWEDAYMLKAMYEQEMARAEERRRATAAPIRVAGLAASVTEEPELWDQIAERVFEELGDGEDGGLWTMPPADSLGAGEAQPRQNKKGAG